MDYAIIFIIGVYIGTEIQAWWYRKGVKMFVEWQIRRKERRK